MVTVPLKLFGSAQNPQDRAVYIYLAISSSSCRTGTSFFFAPEDPPQTQGPDTVEIWGVLLEGEIAHQTHKIQSANI